MAPAAKLFKNLPEDDEDTEYISAGDLQKWGKEVGINDREFSALLESEREVAYWFDDECVQLLVMLAAELGEVDELFEMSNPEMMAWGDENGVDGAELDGTYVGEVVAATNDAIDRYPGKDRFEDTPSIYINGSKIDNNDALSPKKLKEAIKDAASEAADYAGT
ncbi:hypothetical protein CDO52_14520 [Nocardiopsis gilva YIM 90087]|uniref:Uncharacterized protein n=1 Tax=Nocardiopsis gilva YIM 90087 TaxID=1235441 RepID=A0A223S6T8_9ACTN|nr:hypothetical protein [Nocardiopsis gilva]ASU83836.1 hypothetical protein CDO52_14520 [Nocardiopsis gilva YIM 90087]